MDKHVSSNEYFNSLIDFTRDSDYSTNTHVKWQKPDDYSLNYFANKFLTNLSHRQLERRFYSFELNTQIKLNIIDYSVLWSLDSCWLGNDTCATDIQNDMLDLKNFDEYYYDNSADYAYENDYAAYDSEESSRGHKKKDNKPSSEEEVIRKKRNSRQNDNNHNRSANLLYTSNTIFKYDEMKNLYEIYLNITLNGFNVKNLQNSRYFYCYLKPSCSICDNVGDISKVSFYFLFFI